MNRSWWCVLSCTCSVWGGVCTLVCCGGSLPRGPPPPLPRACPPSSPGPSAGTAAPASNSTTKHWPAGEPLLSQLIPAPLCPPSMLTVLMLNYLRRPPTMTATLWHITEELLFPSSVAVVTCWTVIARFVCTEWVRKPDRRTDPSSHKRRRYHRASRFRGVHVITRVRKKWRVREAFCLRHVHAAEHVHKAQHVCICCFAVCEKVRLLFKPDCFVVKKNTTVCTH